MALYLSKEWAHEAERRLRSDPAARGAATGLSFLLRVLEPPPGRLGWLHVTFGAEATELRTADGPEAEAPPADFTVEARYDTLAAIRRGETTEQRAFMAGQLQVKGNRMAALRHLGPMQSVLRVIQGIPCET